MPKLGERIRGDILLSMKGRSNDWYVWYRCPECRKKRWILDWKTRLPTFTGLCQLCNGKQNKSRWNNGMMTTSAGYVYIQKPEHPKANAQGYVRRSHLVLEQKLGRPLRKGCVAHHLNGVVDDDRPKNLMEILGVEHPTLHAAQRRLMRESKREVVDDIVKELDNPFTIPKWQILEQVEVCIGGWQAKLKEWGLK